MTGDFALSRRLRFKLKSQKVIRCKETSKTTRLTSRGGPLTPSPDVGSGLRCSANAESNISILRAKVGAADLRAVGGRGQLTAPMSSHYNHTDVSAPSSTDTDAKTEVGVRLGVDQHGSTHYVLEDLNRVLVENQHGRIEHIERLGERSVAEWQAFVEELRGWREREAVYVSARDIYTALRGGAR